MIRNKNNNSAELLYELKLNEGSSLNLANFWVIRVPGGWIYE